MTRSLFAAAVAALAVAACNSVTTPPPPPQNAHAQTDAPKAEPAKEPEVALRSVKWPELEKVIASHKGQVVVLDVWAQY